MSLISHCLVTLPMLNSGTQTQTLFYHNFHHTCTVETPNWKQCFPVFNLCSYWALVHLVCVGVVCVSEQSWTPQAGLRAGYPGTLSCCVGLVVEHPYLNGRPVIWEQCHLIRSWPGQSSPPGSMIFSWSLRSASRGQKRKTIPCWPYQHVLDT